MAFLAIQSRAKQLRQGGIILSACSKTDEYVARLPITDWVMSCRALGRKVEVAMLRVLKNELKKRDIDRITAQYRPTAKNGMVRDHFDNLGFHLVMEEPDGARHYSAMTSEIKNSPLPIEIDDSAFQR